MLRLLVNQNLLDKHVEKISTSLDKLIENKLKKKLYSKERQCLEYIKTNLINILKADDSEMKVFISYFRNNFPNAIGKSNTKEKNWKRIYKLLRKDIFEKEYDNWGKRTRYGAYSFVKELDLKTCSYCNRNYTFVVDGNSGKLRPEIDHFYPKSIYPFLAMSFYNLIPSCPTCNHTKKDKDSFNQKLKNPYDLNSEYIKFTYIPNSVDFTNVKREKYSFDNFEIKFETSNKNIEVFKLEELYKQHKDIVLDLLIKKAYYPESYINELKSFGFSDEDVYRYLLNNYKKEEDFHKRPLSKLIKDISEELDFI